MSEFEKLPHKTTESKPRLTLEELRKKPVYHTVKRYLVYLAAVTSLTIAAELGARHSLSLEKDKQEAILKNEDNLLTPEQVIKLREQRQYIESEIGPGALNFLFEMHLEEKSRDAKELVIQGVDRIGIETSALKALWSEGDSYPRGWIDEDIDQIDIVDPSDIERPVFGEKRQQFSGLADNKNMMQLAIMDGVSRKKQAETLDWIFSHESGHLNDWAKDHGAKFHERVDLLARAHQRMNAPDRFAEATGSAYGNMEQIKNQEQRQFYLATEYWGTICEYYFTFPEILKDKSPDDFALVDGWVKRQDPNFDPFVAATNRANIIDKIE